MLVTCPECLVGFELSARNARAHRSNATTPRCASCRSAREPRVTPAHRRWWLDRYTLDEIRELAAGHVALVARAAPGCT